MHRHLVLPTGNDRSFGRFGALGCIALLASVALLGGCTARTDGPHTGFLQEKLIDFGIGKHTEQIKDKKHWWTSIGDEGINQDIDTLLAQNLSLQQSWERIEQARQSMIATFGDQYPALGANIQSGRSFTPTANAATDNKDRNYSNNYNAQGTVSWQIDLFGRMKRERELAQASYDATAYDYQALRQSLIIDLISQRITLASYNARTQTARKIVKNQKEYVTAIQRRYEQGASEVTISDTYEAKRQLANAQTALHQYEQNFMAASYAYDLLLGQTPGTLLEGDKQALHTRTKTPNSDQLIALPATLPAALLDSRPDLKASKLRLNAAEADIGIAVADLYPDLNLTGSLGFTSNSTTHFFNAQNLAGSILGNITTRLFEGGALRANIRMKESAAKEQAAIYAEDILTAFEETQTALKNDIQQSKRLQEITRAQKSLRSANKLAEARYRNGLIPLTERLEIENTYLNTKISQLEILQEKWNARLSLYLALGGNWLNTQPSPTKDTLS